MPIILNGNGTISGVDEMIDPLQVDDLTTTNLNGATPGLTLRTAIATTSGTSIDFTDIPSWAKRITVMFDGVSLNSSAQILVQLGTTSGIVTTGYVSGSTALSSATVSGLSSTTGLVIYANGSVNTMTTIMTLVRSSNLDWIESHTGVYDNVPTATHLGAGSITLPDTLTQLRITTSNGTDSFDAGSINILYEG